MSSSSSRVIHPQPGSPRSGAAEQGLTPRFVLSAVAYWWKVALPAALLLGAAGATLAYLVFVPQYEAVAWLRVDERPTFLAFESRYEGRSSSFLNTQVELLRSPLVLGAVAHRPDVARLQSFAEYPDFVLWLTKELRVKPVGESELIKVSLAMPRAADSARIVNEVVNAYFKLRSEDESGRIEQMLKLLEEDRDRRVGELAALRASLQKLTAQAGTQGLPPVAPLSDPAARQAMAELQTRLINAEVEEELLRAKVKVAEQGGSAEQAAVSEAAVERILEDNAELKLLKTALADKRAKLGQIESRSAQGDQDPLFRQLRDEIRADEQSLEQLRAEQRRRARTEMATTAGKKHTEELSALRVDLESRHFATQLLRERSESQLKELKQGGADRSELTAKQAELDRAEKVFELITDRVAKLRTEQRAPGRVSLLGAAELPATPVEALPLRNIGLAALVGLCLPFGLAVGLERLVRRVIDPESLQQQSELSLLAEVPCLPPQGLAPGGAPSRQTTERLQMFAESIDGLRASLLLSDEFRHAKVLAVTSAASGEGKTSLAANLAVSIARATQRPTLLVDGDLRSPSIHALFNARLEPGLAQVLAGKCALADAVIANPRSGVDLLPAGKLCGSPHRVLDPDAWQALLEQARARYAYVILDTPPVLSASESLVLAKAADACLVCAMRGTSRMPQVLKTCQRLAAVGGRVAGIVLSGVSPRQYAYRYGKYARAERVRETLCVS